MNDPGRHSLARSLAVVQEAIQALLRRLDTLTPSSDVDALREGALRQLRQADTWISDAPSPEAREHLMKTVLALHIGMGRLERTRGALGCEA